MSRFQLVESLHFGVLFLSFLGLYLLYRRPSSRRLGVLWSLVLVVFISARSWLGFVRSNPDALGYLMPAIAAMVLAAAVCDCRSDSGLASAEVKSR